MEFIYAKLNKQLEQTHYKGTESSNIKTTIDKINNVITAEICADKIYLHKIIMRINNAENDVKISLDYYCKSNQPFTDCAFTHMNTQEEFILVSGIAKHNDSTYSHVLYLSILPVEDDYYFIMQCSDGRLITIKSSDGYMRD